MTNKTLLTHRNSLLYRKYIKERVHLINEKKLIAWVDMFYFGNTLRFKEYLNSIVGYYIEYKSCTVKMMVVASKFSYIGKKRSEYENNI